MTSTQRAIISPKGAPPWLGVRFRVKPGKVGQNYEEGHGLVSAKRTQEILKKVIGAATVVNDPGTGDVA